MEGFCSTIELHPLRKRPTPRGRPESPSPGPEVNGGGGWI
uniref:Uncharacterized protein n=1 Tax=Magnetospirillum gryphiswaldense TaxID=55518 RepID=A4U4C2_9PROT|nr:hypothetical protein MGR_3797 [Magnetospirillum gryphiswaldense MSR-1]